jgi:OOP family OmpA-OmpF porin
MRGRLRVGHDFALLAVSLVAPRPAEARACGGGCRKLGPIGPWSHTLAIVRGTRRAVWAVGCLVLAAQVLWPRSANAQEFQLHGNVGGVHAVGDPQQTEFGFGAGGAAAAELTFLRRILGVQLEVSGFGLANGTPPAKGIAESSGAFDFGIMAGVRVHPFGWKTVAGLWLDGNGGVAFTGADVRPTFDLHLGYDFRVGNGRFDIGPFIGDTHVFQPSNALVPSGDAHILWAGVHVALGAKNFRRDRDGDTVYDDEDACVDVPGIRTDDPRTNGCPDRDHDGIFDFEDACPDVPGIRTNDPKTNGCPRGDRDHDGIFDDEDACPDVPGIRTNDPKTNGCPRSDRDNDGVFDDEDACPDIPGVRTNDPKTNGCPPAGDQVRLEGDKILLDDIIHFDIDSPRVHHVSFPIIKKVADFITANPDVLEVDIEGHADETGTSEHNLVLSRQRADAVKRIIVQYGVDEKRITTHAYGETRPRVPGHAEEQLSQNRRVEFTVTRSRARPQELNPSAPGAAGPSSAGGKP